MTVDDKTLIGLDIGGTKILGVRVDGAGDIVDEQSIPTQSERGPEPVLADCRAMVERLLPDGREVSALGVGFAGLVDPGAGVVRSSVILAGWEEVPLAGRLAEVLGLPVVVDNDATAAGWGEHVALGRADGSRSAARRRNLLVLTIGTGIGGALFLGGSLQRGAAGLAGEVGHMSVDRHGDLCVCGRRGCLHTLASGTALTAAAARVADEDPGWLRGTGTGDGCTPPSLEQVGGAAAAGDPRALRLVEDGGEALGLGIADLAQLLNPSRVALCGGVVGLGDGWLDAVRRSVQGNVFPEVWESLEIAPALMGSRSGAYGAAHLAARVVQ